MIKHNLSAKVSRKREICVTVSETNPSPLRAFRAISDMDMPFILGGAPCPGHGYSVTGAAPYMALSLPIGGKSLELKNALPWVDDLLKLYKDKNPLLAVSAILKALNKGRPKGPFPFNGGAVGFFSYDLYKPFFKLPDARREKQDKSLGMPLINLGFYDNIYVYDHNADEGSILSRDAGDKTAEEFKDRIESAHRETKRQRQRAEEYAPHIESNTTREEYIRTVERAKEYIASGDIYQINLSQRLDAPFTGDAFELYAGLLEENPTPFSSFLDFGEFQLISNSPERLFRLCGQSMETCPIKGTRSRGATPAEDAKMIDELAHNIKERAEHVMIVDLERNDIGRIALPGTVRVDNFQEIKTFSKLHHMISTVRGEAPPGTDPLLILKNIFPGGSITGAPKIRAMEIIEELEDVPREIYTGGAGFIDYSGDMDLSILIRTAVRKNNQIYLHVGGGIVADSDPLAEYDETILKAMDFLSLLKLRPEGLL